MRKRSPFAPALKSYALRVDQKLIRLPAWRSRSRDRSGDSEATSDDFRADQKVIPSLAEFPKCVKLLSMTFKAASREVHVDQKLIPILMTSFACGRSHLYQFEPMLRASQVRATWDNASVTIHAAFVFSWLL